MFKADTFFVNQLSTATGPRPSEGGQWFRVSEVSSVRPSYELDAPEPIIRGIRVRLKNDEEFVLPLDQEDRLIGDLLRGGNIISRPYGGEHGGQ